MVTMYYTYAYLRENGTPYYIGKGCRDRINAKFHPGISLPIPERRIKLKTNLTEEEALRHEMYMIAVLGRKDLDTGILHNKTEGGDRPPRMTKNNPNHRAGLQRYWDNISPEKRKARREKISKSKKGKGNNLPTIPVEIVELGLKFNSIKECAAYVNGDSTAISKIVRGVGDQYKHRGYTYRRVA